MAPILKNKALSAEILFHNLKIYSGKLYSVKKKSKEIKKCNL